jgi:hypothetical protein
MGNINGKFAEQNDIVTTGQILSANNNQASFNAALADANHLQGTNVTLQPGGLLTTTNAPIPSVATALQGTVGAALGGIGQQGTASQQPGGGGIPCFASGTPISLADEVKSIFEVVVGVDWVKCHDKLGTRINALCIGKWEHWVEESLLVKFRDGRMTHTTANHKYWVEDEIYEPVWNLDWVWHWDKKWIQVDIVEKVAITKPMLVYNLTVDTYHNYEANGDSVSNLKPIDNGESF